MIFVGSQKSSRQASRGSDENPTGDKAAVVTTHLYDPSTLCPYTADDNITFVCVSITRTLLTARSIYCICRCNDRPFRVVFYSTTCSTLVTVLAPFVFGWPLTSHLVIVFSVGSSRPHPQHILGAPIHVITTSRFYNKSDIEVISTADALHRSFCSTVSTICFCFLTTSKINSHYCSLGTDTNRPSIIWMEVCFSTFQGISISIQSMF